MPRQSELTPVFDWDERVGQYRNIRSGRFEPRLAVRNVLETAIRETRREMRQDAAALRDGSISLAEWQTRMLGQIKRLHITEAAAARGGWAQMSQADWGAVGQRIRFQYERLRNFANQIASGEQRLDGRFMFRVEMYANAGRGTYEESVRRFERVYHHRMLERRVLGVADHCEDCLDAAAEGWQPIGTLPAIGDSVCLTNCHCTFEYADELSEDED